MNKNLYQQINKIFFKIMAEEKQPDKLAVMFEDLLGEKEMERLAQRVAAVLYLDKGRSGENIESNLKIEKGELDKLSRNLGNPGLQYLIQHAKAEEFASEWSSKIVRMIKTIVP